MVSLLGECGFKPNTPFMEFPSCFIKVLYAMSSKESIVFISFYKKIWPYNGAITALWQNQIIVIVCSIFLTCLNKVQCFVNGGFYPQQRLINFEKNIKTDTSCVMSSHCTYLLTYFLRSRSRWKSASLFLRFPSSITFTKSGISVSLSLTSVSG